jgi:DNA-directed RNA polymerase specialized sigma24 family protein
MKVAIPRLITNFTARGRSLGSRFGLWSQWFPPTPTVDADRFQSDGEPYPDHWRRFPRALPRRALTPDRLRTALATLPDLWRRVLILRDVEGRSPTEVSAATGLTGEQQRDVLNRARELLREELVPESNRSAS